MITIQEAYLIAKKRRTDLMEEYNEPVRRLFLNSCGDGGDFWYFSFGHVPYDKNDSTTASTGGPDTISKATGEPLFLSFAEPEDYERLRSVVKIPVERVIGESKPVRKPAMPTKRKPTLAAAMA